MHDSDEGVLRDVRASIEDSLHFMASSGLATPHAITGALERLRAVATLREAVVDADVVIESIPEVLNAKAELFAKLDSLCPGETLLASNTSTLSISRIAERTARPARVVGIHWFYPAYIMPPVEIIPGEHTSDRTVNGAKEFVIAAGKTPILCRKEVPGFIINRLQFALFSEATSLLEQGVASAEEIDKAARLSLGLRLPFFGPLMFEDIIGTKRTILAGYDYLYRATGESKFRPPEIIKEMVARGDLGLITGRGHFDYGAESAEAVGRMRDQLIAKQLEFVRQQAPSGYSSAVVKEVKEVKDRGRTEEERGRS